MKKTHLLTLLTLICMAIGVYATDITSDINSSTTWSLAGSPYIITNNINIKENVTLTIEPGVEVKFNQNRALTVYGTLYANSATFTANGGNAKGFWTGILISYPSSGTNYPYANAYLSDCTVEYAKSVHARKGQLTLDSSTLSNLSDGIELHEFGELTILNSSISDCTYPITYSGAGKLNLGENVTFDNNENVYIRVNFGSFTNNWEISDFGLPYNRNGGFTVSAGGSMTINPGVNFQMRQNDFNIRGKLQALGTAENPIVFDKTPDVNYWNGFRIYDQEEENLTILKHCIIQNVSYDSYGYPAMQLNNSYIEIDNCVFQNNSYNLRIQGNSTPLISNSIFRESILESLHIRNIWMDLNAAPVFNNNSIFFNEKEIRAVGIDYSTVRADNRLKKINFDNVENITYAMSGNTTVNEGAHLTIDPGVVIKWYDTSAVLEVDGKLTAVGTEAEPIVFTHIDDDNFGNPLDTKNDGTKTIDYDRGGRIYLRGTEVSRMEYCKLYYGGYSYYSLYAPLNVYNNNIVDNCEIKYASRGVRFSDNAVIINNFFDGINTCAISYLPAVGTPVLTGNTLGDVMHHGINISGEVTDDVVELKKMDFAGYTNIPYVLNDRLTIKKDKALSIEPGVIIKATNFSSPSILVEGQLQAIGTAEEKIIFTSIHDDSKGGDTNNNGTSTIPANNNWNGIAFNSDSKGNDNIIQNCEISYSSTTYLDGITAYSPLAFSSSAALVDEVKISFSNDHGIGVFGDANPIIQNTTFNNINKEPIFMDLFSEPVFGDNIKLSNVASIALKLRAGAVEGIVPKRNFAGYNPITYVLNDRLTINNEKEVTIPEGLVFKGWGEWYVNGKLNILGTTEEPVVFTTIEDDDYGYPADTQNNGQQNTRYEGVSLNFLASSDNTSKIENAIFRYSYRTAINLNNSNITINKCTFEDINKSAITCVGTSEPTITNNIFNNVNYPLTISAVNFPAIETNNVISGTTARAVRLIQDETLNVDATLMKRSFAGIENIPYALGTYHIGTSAILTIEPGVVMKFENGGNLYVKNGLKAIGGSGVDEAIVFTSIHDDFYGGDTQNNGDQIKPHETSWNGLYFYKESVDEDCVLNNCIIKYAGHSSRAGILLANASPTITNTRFEKSYNAIICEQTSFPTISNCDFRVINKNYGYAINNKNTATMVTATNCYFGDESGPRHESNPDGLGERVSDNVNFTPFVTELVHAELGDVSLNGEITAYDASLVLQYAAHNITLSTKQQAVADVSKDNTISSYDASLILKYNVGLSHGFLAPPIMMQRVPAVDYQLIAYGNPINVEDETVVRVPLHLTTKQDISALDISLNFNPIHLELVGLSKENIANSVAFVSKDDVSDGILKLSMASAYSLDLSDGIVYLDFKFKNTDITNSEIFIESVRANEVEVSVEEPAINIKAKSPTGIESVSKNMFKVWIAADNIVLQLNQNMQNAHTQIALFNMSGSLIYNSVNDTTNSDKTYIPLSVLGHLKQGIYLVRVSSGDMVYTEKLMIKGVL